MAQEKTMAFRFNFADVQDNDDSLIFDAICEDVDLAAKDKIELEFSGDNLVFNPPKVALKDIFDQQSGHAHCKVLATPVAIPGAATAIMEVKVNGRGGPRIERGFTL